MPLSQDCIYTLNSLDSWGVLITHKFQKRNFDDLMQKYLWFARYIFPAGGDRGVEFH